MLTASILNVGAGACTVVEHPGGRISMVDINNAQGLRDYEQDASILLEAAVAKAVQAPKTDPIEWFQDTYPGRAVWRLVVSHPDADHMAGIRHLLGGEISVENVWDLPNTKFCDTFRNDYARADWAAYQRIHATPLGEGAPRRIAPTRFASNHYWSEDDIDILSPDPALLSVCDRRQNWNDMSYVLRISHAGRSILLPGDAEEFAWNDLAEACAEEGVSLKSDVLVASHHGRKSGYPGAEIMREINPSATIVSTAPLKPEHDARESYRYYSDVLLSTRLRGDLHVRIHDDGSLVIFDRLGATHYELEPAWRF